MSSSSQSSMSAALDGRHRPQAPLVPLKVLVQQKAAPGVGKRVGDEARKTFKDVSREMPDDGGCGHAERRNLET
mgnify:CR=1 FL=1